MNILKESLQEIEAVKIEENKKEQILGSTVQSKMRLEGLRKSLQMSKIKVCFQMHKKKKFYQRHYKYKTSG